MKLKSGLNEKAEKEEKTIAKPVEKKKTAKEKIIDSKTIEKEASVKKRRVVKAKPEADSVEKPAGKACCKKNGD